MREQELLNHIYQFNQTLPADVEIPPGDDMGGIRIGRELIMVTVDQVADGVHVISENTPLSQIGRKAITRNLSDVAAMGGRAVGAVATGCLPRTWHAKQGNKLFDAMRTTAGHYHCPMIGGDLSFWEGHFLLTVTVLASPHPKGPVLRSGAGIDDRIIVTGQLGGAWRADGGGRHLEFEPRIDTARAFLDDDEIKVNAMIDLSDGLATDLGHICRMSGVDAELDMTAIPLADVLKTPGAKQREMIRHAMTDGEDYELCLVVDAQSKIPVQVDDVPVTEIGRIVSRRTTGEAEPTLWMLEDGKRRRYKDVGWEHHG